MTGQSSLSRGEFQSRAVHGIRWTLVHTVVAIIIGFGVNIVMARVLGVSEYGRLAYLTLMITTAGQAAELGLAGGVVQFGTKRHARGDHADVAELLRKSLGFRLLTFAPAVTCMILAIVQLDPLVLAVAILMGVWVKSFLGGATLSLSIENKTHRAAQNALLVNVLTQTAVLAAVLLAGRADAVWATQVIMATVGVTLALRFVDPRYRRALIRPKLPRRMPAGFWRYALPAGAAAIIGNLLISRTEVLFLTWWDMTVAAGLFAAAFGMANHVFSPAMALVGPLIPAVSGLREVDAASVGAALRRVVRTSSTAVGALLATAIAPIALLLPVIYGEDYSRAAPAFVALGLGAGAATVGGPLSAFLQARLGGGRLLRINTTSLVVNVVAIVTLLPLIGLWGAVIANLCGSFTRVSLLFIGEVRDTAVGLPGGLHDVLPLAAGALSALVAFGAGSVLPWVAWIGAPAAGLAGLALYAIGLVVTRAGLEPSDAAVVATMAPGRLRGPLALGLRVITRG